MGTYCLTTNCESLKRHGCKTRASNMQGCTTSDILIFVQSSTAVEDLNELEQVQDDPGI